MGSASASSTRVRIGFSRQTPAHHKVSHLWTHIFVCTLTSFGITGVQKLGGLTTLVNCAGVLKGGAMGAPTVDLDNYMYNFKVCLPSQSENGTFCLTRASIFFFFLMTYKLICVAVLFMIL